MYVVDKEKARAALPKGVVQDFDDIVTQKVLGASTHIKMIGNMIEQIALEYKTNGNIEEMIQRIDEVCNFFIATRGEASQAITNAIYQMIKGIHHHTNHDQSSEVVQAIIDVKDSYAKSNKKAIDQAVSYAVEIGNRMQNILVYDYSSTVEAFLRGLQAGKTIYIAESRVINGGKPFVKPCIEAGHQIHFIPDASLMYYMKECDGAFMGAESIYPDGTGFNTTGSDIVGLICDYYKKPLYFISPLIKLDVRPVYGKEKTIVINDLKDKLQDVADPDNHKDIDYHTPELLGVCPEHIKGFITEKGVIPSIQLYDTAMQYIKELRGEEDV